MTTRELVLVKTGSSVVTRSEGTKETQKPVYGVESLGRNLEKL